MPRETIAVTTDPQYCCSILEAPLGVEDADDLAAIFGALAEPTRLRLFSLIASAGEVCACDLVEPLQRSQPTISHHTKALAEAGLIIGEKRGRWVWWSVTPGRLELIRRAIQPGS